MAAEQNPLKKEQCLFKCMDSSWWGLRGEEAVHTGCVSKSVHFLCDRVCGQRTKKQASPQPLGSGTPPFGGGTTADEGGAKPLHSHHPSVPGRPTVGLVTRGPSTSLLFLRDGDARCQAGAPTSPPVLAAAV